MSEWIEFSSSESTCLPNASPGFNSIRHTVQEQMSFQDFQDGHYCSGHLGYQKGMILALLNLYVAPMPPIKFQLNPTYGLGDVV